MHPLLTWLFSFISSHSNKTIDIKHVIIRASTCHRHPGTTRKSTHASLTHDPPKETTRYRLVGELISSNTRQSDKLVTGGQQKGGEQQTHGKQQRARGLYQERKALSATEPETCWCSNNAATILLTRAWLGSQTEIQREKRSTSPDDSTFLATTSFATTSLGAAGATALERPWSNFFLAATSSDLPIFWLYWACSSSHECEHIQCRKQTRIWDHIQSQQWPRVSPKYLRQ